MPSPTLFPLHDPLAPSSDRPEPALWLKRIVILPDLHSEDPIRDIPFRRGLNIIQTRRREVSEGKVVGHSVGKTLLTRLIRYTLGESHFAIERVRVRMGEFRTAQVVAHWRVNSLDWIVVRPLQEGRIEKSIAVKDDDWQAAISNVHAHLPLGEFLTAVSQAAMSGIAEFTLPGAQRTPKWLDVLGWLARDCECGYRVPNEWRDDDAEPGPGKRPDRDDNGLILQWMAGLMGDEEIALKQVHQGLLDERQSARGKRESAQRTIAVTGPGLFSKLELIGDENSTGDRDAEGLFAARVVQTAERKIKSLNLLRKERYEKSPVKELDLAAGAARADLTKAEADVIAGENQIKLVEGQIRILKNAEKKSPYAIPVAFQKCTLDACPLRSENRPSPDADPAKDERLDMLSDQVEEIQRSLPGKMKHRDNMKIVHDNAVDYAQKARMKLSDEVSGIDQTIGRWEGYRIDAESYRRAKEDCEESERVIKSLNDRVNASNQSQETVRQNLRDRLNRLSVCYAHILKEVFGEQAEGKISVDGNGLHPSPDNRLGPNGAALSTMTTVLAFDIACLTASIAGIGHHPRFLMHDSPREGDMEEPLFHQLFRVARNLELMFGEKEPSFQYIVTTTTPPPAELAHEEGPFVRQTLHARDPSGFLLRARF